MLVTGRQPPSVKWVSQLHFTLVMDDDLLFSTQDSGLVNQVALPGARAKRASFYLETWFIKRPIETGRF